MAAGIVEEATTEEIATVARKLEAIGQPATSSTAAEVPDAILNLSERIDIAPGEIRIALSTHGLADLLDVETARIADELITIIAPFRYRKRGVETKLVIGDQPAEIDETLFRNIARAHRYFDLIRTGKTFGEIADSEGVSKRRIQHLIELAFLAPDVIRAVHEGRQPSGLTSEWLKRHAFPPVWKDQRELFSTL